MIVRLIIFLIRRRLHLKKFEYFKFTNQKSNDIYYFDDWGLAKIENGETGCIRVSSVSFNWLIDVRCEIKKV